MNLTMRRAAVAAALLLTGCSESDPATGGGYDERGGGGRASGAGGMRADSLFEAAGGSTTAACVAEVQRGEPLPLSMYVMMDTSGSMVDLTAGGISKWEAVATAFAEFVVDPKSAGISVGLEFFPQLMPGVPAECSSHADCGGAGPCTTSFCSADDVVTYCQTAADCVNPASACVPAGRCARDDRAVCPLGASCGSLGACQDWTGKWCLGGTCDASEYATPTVPFTPLPLGADPLIQAMIDRTYFARTPTGPALSGAITAARDWASNHPDDTVINLLATDGLPTECAPTDIGEVAAIAANGLAGSPSIETFVIGVFGPDDVESPANLDRIARAGGTNSALIVDTSGDVTQQFIATLNDIRGSALSCEFQIPQPEAGEDLDFYSVNLLFTEGATERALANVGDASGCSRAADGWYYDVSPESGATPARIEVCPSVCADFKSSVGGEVQLLIGCQTVIR